VRRLLDTVAGHTDADTDSNVDVADADAGTDAESGLVVIGAALAA